MLRDQFEKELEAILDSAYGYAIRLSGGDRDEAEDLLQEATIAAYRGRETFQTGTHFKAWFFKVMTNALYRKAGRKRLDTVSMDADPEPYLFLQAHQHGVDVGADPAEALFDKVDAAEVMKALDALPEEFREVSSLYFTGEMSYEEIAEMLEIPVGTVRSRLHRGRKLLQAALWELAQSRGLVGEMPHA